MSFAGFQGKPDSVKSERLAREMQLVVATKEELAAQVATLQTQIDALAASSGTPSPQTPVWVPYTLTLAQFQALGAVTIGTVAALAVPAKTVVHASILKHSEEFTGGAIVSATLQVVAPSADDVDGDKTSIPVLDVFVAPTDDFIAPGSVQIANLWRYRSDMAVDFEVQLNLGGDNADQLTTGAATVWLLTSLYE